MTNQDQMKKLMDLFEGFEEMSMHTSSDPVFTQLRDFINELKDDVAEYKNPEQFRSDEYYDKCSILANYLEFNIISRLESILKVVK